MVLKWTLDDLAKVSAVSVPTIKRIEARPGVPSSRGDTLNRIEEALRAAGIEFIGSPGDQPGIRWRPPS